MSTDRDAPRAVAESDRLPDPDERSRLTALFRSRAARLARVGEPSRREQGLKVLVARLCQELYGFPLDRLAEVVPLRHWSPVPGWPPALAGVMHRRGLLHPIVDLHHLLGLPAPTADSAYALLLRGRRRELGLRVEQVLGIREVTRADLVSRRDPLAPSFVEAIGPDGLILFDLSRLDEPGVLPASIPVA